MNPKQVGRVILGATAAFSIGAAVAQGFPSKAVKLVVPFAAGGAIDTIARTLAQPDRKSTRLNSSHRL